LRAFVSEHARDDLEVIAKRVPNQVGSVGMPGIEVHGVDVVAGGAEAEVFRVSARGGQPVPTGLRGRGMRNLEIRPDGRQIAYSNSGFTNEIWAVDNVVPASSRQAHNRHRSRQ
jgi:hypothetical protein